MKYLPEYIPISIVLLLAGGCGRSYMLPGHTEDNLNHPPDVVMQIGQHEKAIHDGFIWGIVDEPCKVMKSDNPDVVSIEPGPDDSHTAFLHAIAVGHATVRYYPVTLEDKTGKPNQGFGVTVVPAN